MSSPAENGASLLDRLLNGSLVRTDNASQVLRALLESLNNASSASPPLVPVIDVGSQRQWVLAWWAQLVYSCLFGFMVATAVLGNAAVVWTVLGHRAMRTVTNYFLFNLSLADTMTATFNAIFNLVYMLESHWAFGEPYCVFSNFVANLTVSSSAFTMAAMSIDRLVVGKMESAADMIETMSQNNRECLAYIASVNTGGYGTPTPLY